MTVQLRLQTLQLGTRRVASMLGDVLHPYLAMKSTPYPKTEARILS
jgi:hypothetical protein